MFTFGNFSLGISIIESSWNSPIYCLFVIAEPAPFDAVPLAPKKVSVFAKLNAVLTLWEEDKTILPLRNIFTELPLSFKTKAIWYVLFI